MARALVAVLDSFGIGSAADAEAFGDAGSNTFGHIVDACAAGQADKSGVRAGPLTVPNLMALGLGQSARLASSSPLNLDLDPEPNALYGCAGEKSRGKDTPSGHWEIMGLPVEFDWGLFPKTTPAFPPELIASFISQADLPGILGDCHASGTVILEELGEEHIRTGKPIVYTSEDSVFQIAAHETHFGLDRLYEICRIARGIVDDYNVGRVIARPFLGETREDFKRTANRKDLATPPHAPTLLDHFTDHGGTVIGIGKISDIFAGSGITKSIKTRDNADVYDVLLDQAKTTPDNALVFANFVDFDMLYGHRRDVAGYAAALEAFDVRLPDLLSTLREGDILILTADHGCDPTWRGTEHTREYIPVLATGPGIGSGSIGKRDTFADIGQSLASHLGLPPIAAGRSFLSDERER